MRPLQQLVLVALVLCQIWAVHCQTKKNPVRSAAEDEIKNLPGLTFEPNFKQYSGYLEADTKKPTNRFWHYWFVESQSDPKNDPLVLWLNGGPGCSSLLGLLTELGPMRVAANGSVVPNPYAWNKNANVIFMESPAGVGFTYAVDGDVTADDDTTARANHLALKSFLRKFPQYKNNPLYLTGESYGGVYLPTLAVLVDDDKEMNLKGVAIGNGYLDANKLAESLIFFSYYHGLVGRSTWEGLSRECCDGKPPARGQCAFLDQHRSSACSDLVKQATDQIIDSGVNPYNLYDKCYGQDNQELQKVAHLHREHVDKSLILSAFNVTANMRTGRLFQRYMKSYSNEIQNTPTRTKFQALKDDPPCTDDSVTINYLNQANVKEALHIPKDLNQVFSTCSDISYTMIYPAGADGLAPQIRKLIASPRKLTLLVYNGDVDLMCNFFGDEWFVDDLGRQVITDYSAWHVGNQVAGYAKHYKGISYYTVKGSGHMVPTDRAKEALEMFQTFLKSMSQLQQ